MGIYGHHWQMGFGEMAVDAEQVAEVLVFRSGRRYDIWVFLPLWGPGWATIPSNCCFFDRCLRSLLSSLYRISHPCPDNMQVAG